MQILSRW